MKLQLSYLNDPKLKNDLVSEMKIHQKQDNLIKGSYSKMNGKFKGCAIGCSVQSMNIKRGLNINHDDHGALAAAVGMPEWLMRLQDTLFENLPGKKAKEFPVAFWKVIPVGVNLESVKWNFCAFILKEGIDRVLGLKIEDKLKQQIVEAMRGVLSLHEKALKTGLWDYSAADSARSAAASARSAAASAWFAADSARSAADSAWFAADSARSAADSAWFAADSAWFAADSARSAAYIRYANHLLKILKKAK